MFFPLQASPFQGFAIPVLHSPLGLPHVLTLAAALFALGLFAALAHRSLIRILLGLALMILAAMINFAAFTTYLHPTGLHGQVVTLLLVLSMLAELGIGLTLIAMLLRRDRSAPDLVSGEAVPAGELDALNVDRYDDLKG